MTMTAHRSTATPRPDGTAPAAGATRRPPDEPPAALAGRYRVDLATGAWQWSEQLRGMLQLDEAEGGSGIDVLLSHVHPAEQDAVVAALAGATRGTASSTVQRFRRADGTELPATMVVEPDVDEAGTIAGLTGVLVAVPDRATSSADEAAARVQALEAEVAQLHTAMASRAQIEQAKGVLMLLTGLPQQACFDLLGHISSHTHRKVRDLAAEITASAADQRPLPSDIRAILRDACPPLARQQVG